MVQAGLWQLLLEEDAGGDEDQWSDTEEGSDPGTEVCYTNLLCINFAMWRRIKLLKQNPVPRKAV